MSDSSAHIVGNLTRDLEVRFTGDTGRAVVNGSVAVNRRWKNGDDWVERTSFHNFTLWGATAENAAESLSKGDRVMLIGQFEQRSYEIEVNGEMQKRSVTELNAQHIGPSLQFATAVVKKISKREDPNAPATAPASDPAPVSVGATEEEPF